MIADSVVDVANWIIQHSIFPLFPDNLPFLSYSTYSNILISIKSDVIFAFSIIDKFFPITLLLLIVGLILGSEIILLFIKLSQFFLNIVRGSGA